MFKITSVRTPSAGLKLISKGYGLKFLKQAAKKFTPEEIKRIFPKRTKVFVALEDNNVIDTVGLEIMMMVNTGY